MDNKKTAKKNKILSKKTMKPNFYKQDCRRVLDEFKSIVKTTGYFNSSIKKMIKKLPEKFNEECRKNYLSDSEYYDSKKELLPKNVDELFENIHHTITHAPEWKGIEDPFNGLPLINVFAKFIATEEGFLFFGHAVINDYMKKILMLWKKYLMSPESKYVLTKDGWLGMDTMELFKINKKDKYYGFKSWNDFFIRKFKNINESRPLSDSLVVSACDCHLIIKKHNLEFDTNYLNVKGDIYSLSSMLGIVSTSIKKKFIGGTLLQGYLSAENYHRYHSPVEGKLIFAAVIPGTYFFVNDYQKKNKNIFCGQDQVMQSQGFLSNIQTRAVYIFKTKKIGYVAFIAVGMTEVSSCIVYKRLVGKIVKKGQEIGHFQYGGSTNVIIFEKDYVNLLNFLVKPSPSYKDMRTHMKNEKLTKVRSGLADLISNI